MSTRQVINRVQLSSCSSRIFFLPLVLLFTGIASLFADPPAGRDWKLEWADEFNDSFSTTIWHYWNNNQWRDNNGHHVFLSGEKCLSVANGSAIITVRQGGDTAYAAGLETNSRYGAGYYEARVKSGKAWSTFWLQAIGADCSPPENGCEFDIMENCCPGSMQHAIHWGGYGSCHKSVAHKLSASQTGFHVFGLRWNTDSGATFYVDGIRTFSKPDAPANAITGLVRLTTESENIGATYEIDYVRYYKDNGPATSVKKVDLISSSSAGKRYVAWKTWIEPGNSDKSSIRNYQQAISISGRKIGLTKSGKTPAILLIR